MQIYKQGTLHLMLYGNNNVISYKNLDTFLNDYKQNNFITNIEYFVHGIPEINITFNIYHWNFYTVWHSM